MTIPRNERLRITQEIYKKLQEIYGDREDTEAELANWGMLERAKKNGLNTTFISGDKNYF